VDREQSDIVVTSWSTDAADPPALRIFPTSRSRRSLLSPVTVPG
jgi:hypothetical protein